MDYRQFMKILQSGIETGKESIQSLEEYSNEFPYFQTAHLLLAKSMHDHQHVRYEKQLKKAAAYSGDRKFLYELINQNQIKLTEADKHEIVSPLPVEDKTEKISPIEINQENIFEERSIDILTAPTEIEEKYLEAPSEIRSEQVYSSPVFFSEEEEPLADEFNEESVADPHDIIRKRLVEILGLRDEIKEVPEAVNIFKPASVPIVQEETEKVVGETIITNTEKKETEVEGDNEFEIPITYDEEIKPEQTVESKPTDILEELVKESTKAVDFVQSAELEYALEASLIQSIEKLPVIETAKEIVSDHYSDSNEHRSFYDWLKLKTTGEFGKIEIVHAYDEVEGANKQEDISEKASEKSENAEDISSLIDRFIESEPRIVPSKTEFYSPVTQAKRSVMEDEDLVSETLAKIYFQQGNYTKAITSYQKLSLLFPEKLDYFAALISETEQAINNQDKQNL
jgi:tetratricopeptide (TPR) repeat protein